MILYGKNIIMRTVNTDDAKFVYMLRSDQEKTKYLSHINATVESQREWIIKYKEREAKKEEYYFIIESKEKKPLGLVRMYDFRGDSFCWGSWIIKGDAPKTTAIESALQIYEFAFKKLNFKQSHFDVRKKNTKVIAFHKRFGATIVDKDEINYYFNFTHNDYKKIQQKYKRYLQ
jgi:RimJ/RimL family protein N-acetyltransferase